MHPNLSFGFLISVLPHAKSEQFGSKQLTDSVLFCASAKFWKKSVDFLPTASCVRLTDVKSQLLAMCQLV